MTTYRIQRCTVADIEKTPELLEAYAAESALDDLGPTSPQFDTYRMMEAAGIFYLLGVFDAADTMVGFLTMIVAPLPHFGVRAATSESYYVIDYARKGGTGTRLRREAERWAEELGAVGLFISAPVGGRLHQVLPRSGYRETNRTFFRKFHP